MTDTSKTDIQERMKQHERQFAADDVNAWFDNAISTLRRQAEDLERHKHRFNEAAAGKLEHVSPDDVVVWAVDTLDGMSFGPGRAVRAAVRLTKALAE